MRSYWFILPAGVAIGLGLVVPVLWRYRREYARGFKETLGIAVDEDPVMRRRVDALSNAKPVGRFAIVELTVIAIAAAVAFSIGVYNGGYVAVICFVLGVALVVLFNIVLLGQMPALPDRVERDAPGGSPGQDPSPGGASGRGSDNRLPAWWVVGAAICLLLVLGGLVAAATGDLTVRLILGVPGALGLLGLALWARHSRRREPAPSS